jgi:hypothetical protein
MVKKACGKFYTENVTGPLALAEIITLNILRFHYHVQDLKAFHRLASHAYRAYFPGMPNYENFLKATNKSMPFVLLMLRYFLLVNRELRADGLFFVDSMPLSVCDNHYIYRHKVTAGFSSRGKTSKGWFFGFKLHGVCDVDGNLVTVRFTTGSVHDNKEMAALAEGLEGMFVGDAGYLLKQEEFKQLFEEHKRILSAARKNMKRLMTREQGMLFRKRSIIETVWDVLKERYNLAYHLARNMTGLFRHYCYSLVSYLLKPVVNQFSSLLSLPY